MKDRYFPHDYNARGDEKIARMIRALGWESYGLYWALVERLYENGGKIADDSEQLAYDFRADLKLVKSIVSDHDLFYRIGSTSIGSKSVDRRLRAILEKRKKAQEAGRLGGLAKAKQTLSDSQAEPYQERTGETAQRKGDVRGQEQQQLKALYSGVKSA